MDIQKLGFSLEHYGTPLLEYGVWANGHAIQTCGPHTGHTVRTIALCQDEQVADAFAKAFTIAAAVSA